MKKLNSGVSSFAGAKLLSKDEMKNVRGGSLEKLENQGCGAKGDPCG